MACADPIGHSITKSHRKSIWNPFIGAIRRYELLAPGDRVAVCVSGGKDSMLLAKCFQLLQRYSDFQFDVCYLAMDPGYNTENRRYITENAEKLGVSRNIRGITQPVDEFSIEPQGYDLILASSVLEHLDSRDSAIRKMQEIAAGIRPGGAAMILMNTGVKEWDADTGEDVNGIGIEWVDL